LRVQHVGVTEFGVVVKYTGIGPKECVIKVGERGSEKRVRVNHEGCIGIFEKTKHWFDDVGVVALSELGS